MKNAWLVAITLLFLSACGSEISERESYSIDGEPVDAETFYSFLDEQDPNFTRLEGNWQISYTDNYADQNAWRKLKLIGWDEQEEAVIFRGLTLEGLAPDLHLKKSPINGEYVIYLVDNSLTGGEDNHFIVDGTINFAENEISARSTFFQMELWHEHRLVKK